MKIYIIRHGETQWNVQKRLQGASETQLNEKGIALAKATGEALREIPFTCCFTSPLKRAKDTAALILGERKIPVFEDPRIREISFGEWEGQNSELLPEDRIHAFFHQPEQYVPPKGGESLESLLQRTGEFLKEMISREDLQNETVLVTTHGCALRGILSEVYEDFSLKNFWHGKVPPNCSVSVVEAREGRAFLVQEDMVYYLGQ